MGDLDLPGLDVPRHMDCMTGPMMRASITMLVLGALWASACGGPPSEVVTAETVLRRPDGRPHAAEQPRAQSAQSASPTASADGPPAPHVAESHMGRHAQEQTPPLIHPYPPPPVPPPAANDDGCVPGSGDYGAQLEAHQHQVRDAELASLGGAWESREGFFIDDSFLSRVGQEYEASGRRFAVVAHSDQRTPRPKVRLARRGEQLHIVEEHARSIPVALTACGVRPCPAGSGVMVRSRAVSIELAPDESLGEPLILHYDFWWLQLGYAKSRVCPPPPPSAMAR